MKSTLIFTAFCYVTSSLLGATNKARKDQDSFLCGDGIPQRNCLECGECHKRYLIRLDFYKNKLSLDVPGRNAIEWLDFGDGFYTTDCRGAKLDSNPFDDAQLTNVMWMDNFKYYLQAMAPITLPMASDLVFEYLGGAKTFLTEQNPYPENLVQLNDWRLAHGIFSVFDMDHWMFYGFYLTNDRIYIFYSRLASDSDSIYAKFQFVVPVAIRNPGDEHDMKVVFHPVRRQVSYRLGGREVLRILRPGYHLDRLYMVTDGDGRQESVWPKELFYGFGTGTSVDSYAACKRSDDCCDCQFPSVNMALANTGSAAAATLPQFNPQLGPPTLASYWRGYEDDVISVDQRRWYVWGQGVELTLKKLVIYQDSNCLRC